MTDCQCNLYALWMEAASPICKKAFAPVEPGVDSCAHCTHSEGCHGETEKQKTDRQRNAYHLWCEQLAKVLNDAGIDQTIYFKEYAKKGFKVPWTKISVKETFLKTVLSSMAGKLSTEEMNTVEPGQICQAIGKRLSETTGITPPPFPSRFNDQ